MLLATLGLGAVAAGTLGIIAAAQWSKRRRKARFAVYGHELKTFHLPQDGEVQLAQWLHPQERSKAVRQESVTLLRRYIREGDLVIDIGAHSGDTTIPLALAAGPTGTTLALEPNPYVFAILKVNAGLNPDKTHIVPLNFAATQKDGVFVFNYSDGAFCNGGFMSQIKNRRHGHHEQLGVRGCNLEQVLRREYGHLLHRLSFIKIDTEGYDRQVILSLQGLLREYRPVLVCEILPRLVASEREALFDALDQAGYETFDCEDSGSRLGERLTRQGILKCRQREVLAIPREKLLPAAVLRAPAILPLAA